MPRDSRLLANYAAPGARNAVRTTVHRLWLAPLFHVDPDVAYFRTHRCAMDAAEKGLLRDLALVCGFKATSDIPSWLAPDERSDLLAFLASRPRVERTGRYAFALDGRQVDFSPAVPLPRPMRLAGAAVGWLAGRRSGAAAVRPVAAPRARPDGEGRVPRELTRRRADTPSVSPLPTMAPVR